jgi:predicted nucleotidyltransferase
MHSIFEGKLHIVHGAEGRTNDEGLQLIRQLEVELQNYESFIGLAPFGSVVGGYGTKESDIDVFILYDEPSNVGVKDEIENDFDRLWSRAFEWQEEISKRGYKVDFVFQDVNPDYLMDSIKSWLKDDGTIGEYVPLSLEAMSRVVTGKKIEQYRKIIATRLNELDPTQREIVRDAIVESLMKREEFSLPKRSHRLPEISEGNQLKILEARKTMWQSRIFKFWGL